MTGLTYPYARHDRLLAGYDDLDLEFSPAPNPPAGTAGGAGRFKYWVDNTDVNNGILRQCVVARATAGAYVPGEWITLGVIDASNHKFHFNTDNADFTGGSGSLMVHDLTVSGGTHLNTLDVSGAANLNTLNVSGASALHATSVTGNLSVTGQIAGGSLAISGASSLTTLTVSGASSLTTLTVSGDTNLTTLEVAGATSLHNTTVTGDLTATGTIIGGTLTSLGGVNGVLLNISGNAGIDGDLTVSGNLGVTGACTLDGPVVCGTLTSLGGVNGVLLNISGNAGIDGDLTVSGNLGVTGSSSMHGPIVCDNDITATQHYKLINAGVTKYALYFGPDSGGTISMSFSGPTFSGTVGTQVNLYDNRNYYKAVRHEFQAEGDTPAVMAVFMDGSSSNQTGSWSIICDDTVKENVSAYSAGLADILKLNPVSFNYYVPASRGRDAERWSPFADPFGTVTPTTHFGLLASNVRDVLPEMAAQISYGDPGPSGLPSTPLWTISPTHLVWVLTNAVKELATQDDELDTRLTVVEGHTPPVITITGDITGSGTPTINATLPVVNSNPGTFQGLIVNAKGQVTGASNMHYAPLASPIFTGTPTAPAPASRNDASLQLATTAFVRLGTTTNDDAPAGQLGEFVSGQLLSTAAVALSNNVDTSLATISLSAGEWEVWGSGGFALNANNATQIKVWINPTGATAAPALDQLGGLSIMPITNNVLQMIMPVTSMRVTLAATTTIRLGATATFTGSISAYGKIMARRVR